jgi:O-Antigen ligase
MTYAIRSPRQFGLSRIAVIWCVALGSFTVPLAFGRLRYGFDPSYGYSLTMWVGLVDIMLGLAVILGGRTTFTRVKQRTSAPLVDAAVLLLGALIVSTLIHPIDRGVGIIVRLAGAIVVTDWLGAADRKLLRTLGTTVAALALFQWALGLVQLTVGGPLGLWFLGERGTPLFRFGTSYGPAGTFFHCYLLAGFVSVAMGVTNSLALRGVLGKRLAVAVTVAGTSSAFYAYSRVSVISAVLFAFTMFAVAVFQREHRRFALTTVGVVIATAAISLALTFDGWTTKVEYVSKFGATTGRTELLQQNFDAFLRHPWIGVGTGRYTLSLLDEGRKLGVTPRPPHMVPMAALNEAGMLAAPALLAQAAAIGLLIWRRRWGMLLPIATLLSPLFLEQFMWNTPEGMMMVALGFGAAGIGATWKRSDITELAEPRVTVSIS